MRNGYFPLEARHCPYGGPTNSLNSQMQRKVRSVLSNGPTPRHSGSHSVRIPSRNRHSMDTWLPAGLNCGLPGMRSIRQGKSSMLQVTRDRKSHLYCVMWEAIPDTMLPVSNLQTHISKAASLLRTYRRHWLLKLQSQASRQSNMISLLLNLSKVSCT